MEPAEEWRPIARDPRRLVSNLGRVWNRDTEKHRGRIHAGAASAGGYRAIRIDNQNIGVHRLVLEAFVGPAPSPAHQGAHGNGVRIDNRLGNVRWATPKENALDKLDHGTWGRLTVEQVQEIQRRRKAGERTRAIAADFGVTGETVNGICRGHTWNEVLDGWTFERTPKPPAPCVNCTHLTTRTWAGRCHACNEYHRRNGRDRVLGPDGRVPSRALTIHPCNDCGRADPPRIIKGVCPSCFNRVSRERVARRKAA